LHDVGIEPGSEAEPAQPVAEDRALMRGKSHERLQQIPPDALPLARPVVGCWDGDDEVFLHDDARLNAGRHEIPPSKADIHFAPENLGEGWKRESWLSSRNSMPG
jgi:hypothetical protein